MWPGWQSSPGKRDWATRSLRGSARQVARGLASAVSTHVPRRMRLWTIHPRHLDPAGLVALWREALLAQAVLLGRTRGYTRHPQLERFRTAADPIASIGAYLRAV